MTKETKGLTQQEMYRKLIDEYNKGAKKRDQVTTVSEAIDKTKKLEAKEKKKKNFGMEDIAFRPVEIVGL